MIYPNLGTGLAIALVIALGTGPIASQTKPAIKHAGEIFQKRCAQCHVIPDPAVRTDQGWLDQVNRTAWTSTPKRVRAALIKWLADDNRKRPVRFQTSLGDDKRSQAEPAWVKSNLEQGSIILQGPNGDVALDWKKDDSQRVRGIPPGTYRLRTVRVERVQDKVHWCLSSTTPPKKPLSLRSNKKITLKVPDTVHFNGKVHRKGKRQLQLGFGIQSKNHHGMSIYRDGKRVPVAYKVLSTKGKALAWGKMNYGWGGGGWASVKLKRSDAVADRVEYSVETGPFELKGKTTVAIPKWHCPGSTATIKL